jgi:hypothetical protein
VNRDQLSRPRNTAMTVHERRMETSRKVWESSCRRKRQDVDGQEVFEEAGTRDRALSTDR